MAAEAERIEPRLSTFDTAMVVFSLVVGIGIFRTPAIVARAAGSRELVFTAWIAAGAVSLIGALVFAEIGARRPRAGGYDRVVADCYHPALAFMLNWSQTIMQGAGAAGVAFIGADYLAPIVLPPRYANAHSTFALACASMLVLLALNYRGVRLGARAQNLLSLLKIALMAALVICAFTLVRRAGVPAHARIAAADGSWPMRLATALVPCFYAYGGYHLTMNLGADLKNARRRCPLAIAAGVLTVVTLYLLLNFAYQRVLGQGGVAGSPLVAAALTGALFGRAGKAVVSTLVFLSAAGFVNATIVHMPRTFYAMAEDGALPRAFMRVNARTQAQEAGGFAMRGYPLLPAFYILFLLTVAVRVAMLKPALALAGGAILLTGWPLFRFGRRLFGAPRAPEAAP